MQTLTFTQKLLRQRRFLSSIIPLLALFLGLGASQSASAQGTIGNSSVFVDNTTPGAVNTTYGGSSSVIPNFDNAQLGSFDINAPGALLLNGGEFTATQTGAIAPQDAFLTYQIFNASTNANVGALQTILLPLVSGSTFTYREINALRDLISPITTSGSYGVEVTFSVNFGGRSRVAEPIRTAFFTVTGIRPAPTSIGNSNVFINKQGMVTPNLTFGASSGATPLFQGADLGAYDINDGLLTLNGGNATTFESNGDVVQNAQLNFLVVKPTQNGQPGSALPQSTIALTQVVNSATANNGGTSRTFSNTTALRNLISGLANSGIGTYTVSVAYEAVVLRSNGSTFTVRDDNGGNGYTATFTTTGIPIQINTWTGGRNDDWFNPGNWNLNRIPDAITNVVIPDFGTGINKVYPNIFAGSTFVASDGTTVVNDASGPALARNIDMQGSSQAQRSIMRLKTGRLRVFGSFFNTFDSYIQSTKTVIEFASTGNQSISGGTFVNVELSGAGTKALLGIMRVSVSMAFMPNSGLFTTDISQPADNFLELAARSTDAPNGAQLTGETETGYVRGFARTTRTDVLTNEVDPVTGQLRARTYGNLGVTLLFTGTNNPGDVVVTRNTAESYTPLVRQTSTGLNTERFGIRRIFGVRPSNTQPLQANMTFRYLDNELTNLGPNGTGTVSEPNLALFVSTSGGNQFGFLGVDALDQVNNILTKNGVRTFATFTLGDKTNPLPVSLVAFDAKRVGNDALVTWETASELNNKGYDVQVSNNGKEYRTLGFVAAESPNSNNLKKYSFVDGEKNKAGQRYYRLRQVDVNGKENYFSPRIVNFEGKATDSSLSAYPNPFNNADQFNLSLETVATGTGQITVTDMTGRTISRQNVEVVSGSNNIPVRSMGELKAGLYLVKVILPSGEMKSLKVVKQ